MLWLLACASTFVLPEGREPIRAALRFPVEEEEWVLLSNSYLACGQDVQDRPGTAIDEEASARTWSFEQARSLWTREGAIVVLLRLPGPGAWEIGQNAGGTWYTVEEAVAASGGGAIPLSQPTAAELILEVAEGEAELTEGGAGSFSFETPPVRGNFEAAVCDDPNLTAMLRTLLLDSAVLAPLL
ncbi:MAG TPA: hypothetical protein PKY30_10730 [Myxococcota bacterium]|nr:hypothetical protein [Myxococcota bacterium]